MFMRRKNVTRFIFKFLSITKKLLASYETFVLPVDGITSVSEESQKHSSMLDSAVQPEDLMQKGCMDSQILLCCQDGLHLFSLGSIIQAPFFYLSLLQHFLLFSYIRQFVIDYVIIGRYQPCT